jgi:hypothetical protein
LAVSFIGFVSDIFSLRIYKNFPFGNVAGMIKTTFVPLSFFRHANHSLVSNTNLSSTCMTG